MFSIMRILAYLALIKGCNTMNQEDFRFAEGEVAVDD